MLKPNQSTPCSCLRFSIIERYKIPTLACEVYIRIYFILHSVHLALLLISFCRICSRKENGNLGRKDPVLINTQLQRKRTFFSGKPAHLTFYFKKHFPLTV